MIQADVIASSKLLEKQPALSSMKTLVNVVVLRFLNSSIQLESADLTRKSFNEQTLYRMHYPTFAIYIMAYVT